MKINTLTAFVALASSLTGSVLAAPAPAPAPAPTPPKLQYFSGFNFASTRPDGSCKTRAQYEAEFKKVKSWSPNSKALFDTVKLFSTADCNALAEAVPAAIAQKVKIWAGVWAVDHGKFEREKKALEDALKAHGSSWLKGVNVGSESLYRKEIDPGALAGYIYDVKGMVQIAYGAAGVPVGTADTWTSWVDGTNVEVVKASDVIVMNAFPYWQGSTPANALTTFREAIWNTRKAVGNVKQIVIGETGWPSAGPSFGAADATKENLQKYYTDASCWLQNNGLYSWFWFSAFDQPERSTVVEQNFGIATSVQVPKVNFKCPA